MHVRPIHVHPNWNFPEENVVGKWIVYYLEVLFVVVVEFDRSCFVCDIFFPHCNVLKDKSD